MTKAYVQNISNCKHHLINCAECSLWIERKTFIIEREEFIEFHFSPPVWPIN